MTLGDTSGDLPPTSKSTGALNPPGIRYTRARGAFAVSCGVSPQNIHIAQPTFFTLISQIWWPGVPGFPWLEIFYLIIVVTSAFEASLVAMVDQVMGRCSLEGAKAPTLTYSY